MPLLVSALINTSLRIAHVMGAPGRGPSPEQVTEGFNVLNSMLDAWKAQRLMIYAVTRNVFPLNSGQDTYIIGMDPTDGPIDWEIDRPEKIEQAGFLFTDVDPVIEQPMRVLWGSQEWASVSPKLLQSNVPYILYYEPSVPNGRVSVFPVPLNGWQIALYLWQAVEQFVTSGDTVIIPPAYQEAIEYNLAMRLADRFENQGGKMTESAMLTARNSLRTIRSINSPAMLSQCESANNGRDPRGNWNIFSNSYVIGP